MPDELADLGARFRGVAVLEGVETSDRRFIEPNALTWRDLPISLQTMIESSHGGIPQTRTAVSGRIDLFERREAAGGGLEIYFEGNFDTGDVGVETERQVRNGTLTGVSVDLTAVEVEIEITEEDEDGWPTDWLERYVAGEIAAATVCPIPAFSGAYLELVDAPADDAEEEVAASGAPTLAAAELPAFRVLDQCAPCADREAVTAAGATSAPVQPPAAWFDNPTLDGPTPLTVTDDGRVFGHLALWGTCHVGLDGRCVTPPRSPDGAYAHYRLAAVRTAEGTDVPTGVLTIGTGHAPVGRGLSPADVIRHYDDTGTAFADVAAGEDDHGIWIAGALRPDVDELQLRRIRGSVLSGDWRQLGGRLQLVAALAVNVPGYAIPRTQAHVAAGAPVALVAAGVGAAVRLREQTRGSDGDYVTAAGLDAALQRALAPLVRPVIDKTAGDARARMAARSAERARRRMPSRG